jgi:hypothetical protein
LGAALATDGRTPCPYLTFTPDLDAMSAILEVRHRCSPKRSDPSPVMICG